jgi:glycolate dehydrogenase FAD-linked subunit
MHAADPRPTVDPDRAAAFLAALRTALPDLRLTVDPLDLEAHRRDETAELEPPVPIGVAFPTSTDEVAGIVRLAAARRVPLVARGGGTGLSGGAAAVAGGLVVSFARMDRIVEIDEENQVAVVQPGVVNADLNAALAGHGLLYAPDPASFETCTIGGNLGTNAGGLCCVKYGVTRDAVLGLEVVLADGSVIRTGGRNVKDVAGYDLTGLFVGSMGTLGIITEATLRLIPMPAPKQTLLAFFPTIEAAGEAVAGMVRDGVRPCTLELMDAFTIRAVNAAHGLGLDEEAAAMLLVESDLPGAAGIDELDRAERACERAGVGLLVRAQDATEADLLRQGRRMAHWALEALGGRMEDVVVPRSRVPALLHAIHGIADRRGIRIGVFGHAGDGNLHPSFILDPGDPAAAERFHAAHDDLFRVALELGGSVTGEHGIGVTKRAWLEPTRGADAVRAMQAIKAALDPLGILNPGKVL